MQPSCMTFLPRLGQMAIWLATAWLLACLLAVPAKAVMMAETTGRAVIISADQLDEARARALEEALWLAALQGGARIDGFSSVGTDAALSEHFALRPESRILDYMILSESRQDDHYQISVRAAVGDMPEPGCQPQRQINITLFASHLDTDSQAPAYAAHAGQLMLDQLAALLADHPRLASQFAREESYQPARLARVNRDFDYQSLVGSRRHLAAGHLAVVPSLQLRFERGGNLAVAPEKLNGLLRLTLYQDNLDRPAGEYSLPFTISLGSRVWLRSLTLLSRPARIELEHQMRSVLPGFIDQLAENLACQPIQAEMSLAQGQLVVHLPAHHGLKQNQLARTTGEHTAWTLLRIIEAGTTEIRLAPLDSSRDLARLDGKTVEFMEMN